MGAERGSGSEQRGNAGMQTVLLPIIAPIFLGSAWKQVGVARQNSSGSQSSLSACCFMSVCALNYFGINSDGITFADDSKIREGSTKQKSKMERVEKRMRDDCILMDSSQGERETGDRCQTDIARQLQPSHQSKFILFWSP